MARIYGVFLLSIGAIMISGLCAAPSTIRKGNLPSVHLEKRSDRISAKYASKGNTQEDKIAEREVILATKYHAISNMAFSVIKRIIDNKVVRIIKLIAGIDVKIEKLDDEGIFWIRSSIKSVDYLLKKLRAKRYSNLFRWVEPNRLIEFHSDAPQGNVLKPDDPLFDKQWGLNNDGLPDCKQQRGDADADVDAPEAWNISTGSRDIVVVVMDSGIDYKHKDLAKNIWSATEEFKVQLNKIGPPMSCPKGSHGLDAVTGNCTPEAIMDSGEHGTQIAGIIGAMGNNLCGISGVNHEVSIMGVKISRSLIYTSVKEIIVGLNFIRQVKERFGKDKVWVVNCSWGKRGLTPDLVKIKEHMQSLNRDGVLLVASAGNDGVDTDDNPHFPSGFGLPNLISVTGTDSKDCRPRHFNYGKGHIDLAAPAVNIQTTSPNNQYSCPEGTSFAAPFVSGAAALMLSRCNLDISTLKRILIDTVDRKPSLVGMVASQGRLNLFKALEETCRVCVPRPPQCPSP